MANNKLKVLEGAMAGAVLGVIAGIMLAPESGKALRKDVQKKSAEFYRYVSQNVKKLKRVSENDYKALVRKLMNAYSKSKKLSAKDIKKIVKDAENYWKQIKMHA